MDATLSDIVDADNVNIRPRILEESSLYDKTLPDIEGNADDVTYTIVKKATSKGRNTLTDSYGYCYSIKPRKSSSVVYWRCVVRNRSTNCRATVTQTSDGFKRGIHQHICCPRIGMGIARKITAKVRNYDYSLNICDSESCSTIACHYHCKLAKIFTGNVKKLGGTGTRNDYVGGNAPSTCHSALVLGVRINLPLL